MSKQMPIPRRFYSLDVLRGVAALSVVLGHWQHFFFPFNKQGVTFSLNMEPMFDALYIFYQYGGAAVQLFFCLSGFIFFWLYSKRIAEREITLKSFSVLRISRLYPLHFATLIFVAIGQIAYSNATNTYFVYSFNDSYHFFLNLFFASSWGFENGFSFNAPIWSVSIEVLLYATFFVFCRLFHRNMIALFVAVIIGHYLLPKLNGPIANGVECFFLGGILYLVYERIIKGGDAWKVSIWLPMVAIIVWFVTIKVGSPNDGFIIGEAPWIMKKIVSAWAVFILFPVTILSLALLETRRGTLGKRLSFFGDISYSTYLLHFPLQLTTAFIATKLTIDETLYYAPWFMVFYFFVLISVSLASHRYFEVPMQRYLRLKLNPS